MTQPDEWANGLEPDEVMVLSVWGRAERIAGNQVPPRIRAMIRPGLLDEDGIFYATEPDEIINLIRRWLTLVR